MHANVSVEKRKQARPGLNRPSLDRPVFYHSGLDRKAAMGSYCIGGHDNHDLLAPVDHLHCTTLTELVVGFLERYDKSVCSFR
jgi:hypothetical protein